jgi:hypothetical protein
LAQGGITGGAGEGGERDGERKRLGCGTIRDQNEPLWPYINPIFIIRNKNKTRLGAFKVHYFIIFQTN